MKKFFIVFFVSLLCLSIISNADSFIKTIDVVFNKINIKVNGKTVSTENILYKGTTYAPIRNVAEMLGKDVVWDASTNTANINDKNSSGSSVSSDTPLKLNAFYAVNSFDQFKDFERDKSIQALDTLSFGWSTMEYDSSSGTVSLNLSSSNNNSFFIPYGYNDTLLVTDNYNIPIQLNVYASENLSQIFENKTAAVNEIIKAVNGFKLYGEDIYFNSVVVDFEGLYTSDKEAYLDFLDSLKKELNIYKKNLYVAVPPNTWNNAYDYREISKIADYIIFMAHDYDTKQLKSDYYIFNDIIYTPLTPVDEIRKSLEALCDPSYGVIDTSKVLLQINFGTSQWKIKEGKLYDSDNDGIVYPNTPTYEMIYSRLKSELERGKNLDDIMFFDEKSKNPYIYYYNEVEGTKNIIWYEDSRSVAEKINLAKEYGLGGISVWRIGNIPEFFNYKSNNFYLDVWKEILDNLN